MDSTMYEIIRSAAVVTADSSPNTDSCSHSSTVNLQLGHK